LIIAKKKKFFFSKKTSKIETKYEEKKAGFQKKIKCKIQNVNIA